MINSISGSAMPVLPEVIKDNPAVDATGTKHVQRGDLLAARRPEAFENHYTQMQEKVASVQEKLERLDYGNLENIAAHRSAAEVQGRPLTPHAGQLGAPDTTPAEQLVGEYLGYADQPGGPDVPMLKLETQA